MATNEIHTTAKMRKLSNVTVKVKWQFTNELKFRVWLAKALVRLAVRVLGCNIEFEEEANDGNTTEVL